MVARCALQQRHTREHRVALKNRLPHYYIYKTTLVFHRVKRHPALARRLLSADDRYHISRPCSVRHGVEYIGMRNIALLQYRPNTRQRMLAVNDGSFGNAERSGYRIFPLRERARDQPGKATKSVFVNCFSLTPKLNTFYFMLAGSCCFY